MTTFKTDHDFEEEDLGQDKNGKFGMEFKKSPKNGGKIEFEDSDSNSDNEGENK